MANRYCYCNRIKPGHTKALREHYAERGRRALSSSSLPLWERSGLTHLSMWIQSRPEGDYLVRYVEGGDLERMFSEIREAIAEGDQEAIHVQKGLQHQLGIDIGSILAVPQIEQIFDRRYGDRPTAAREVFIFPILNGKEELHRAYSDRALHSDLQRASVAAAGVERMTKWYQTTPEGTLMLLCQESADPAWDRQRSVVELANHSAWREIAPILEDHTGLRGDELNPQVELVFSHSLECAGV